MKITLWLILMYIRGRIKDECDYKTIEKVERRIRDVGSTSGTIHLDILCTFVYCF